MLEKIFKLKANNTNVKTEIAAGITTFMTMVKQEEGKAEKNPLYYKAYTDFQEAYVDSLEAYYFILFAAEDRI